MQYPKILSLKACNGLRFYLNPISSKQFGKSNKLLRLIILGMFAKFLQCNNPQNRGSIDSFHIFTCVHCDRNLTKFRSIKPLISISIFKPSFSIGQNSILGKLETRESGCSWEKLIIVTVLLSKQAYKRKI